MASRRRAEHPATLTTARLRLRELTLADTDALLEVLGDPEVMRYYPSPRDRAGTEQWIRATLDSYATAGFGLWAIERLEDGAFLGDCGPMLQPVEGRSMAEVGYHLLRREWGKGYATEAAEACVEWVFRETDHDRVCSIVRPDNLPSRRVAARIHRQMRPFIWERAGFEMCLFATDRDERGQPTLAARAIAA
ncbi:MAG: GNAT family N-acetyltransferase [Candidatus Limnocylindrales bacterium]